MRYLEERNQKIIESIVKKAEIVCPNSLALIGIYGSFITGDFYEKSDLDLLILINDDRGWQLGCTFIQDDLQVGHDLYCTNWEQLQNDAQYNHPNISKLMDAKIVYCADEKYKQKLDTLRQMANDILSASFSEEDYTKAEKFLKEAEHYYAMTIISDDKLEILESAGKAVYCIENAIAMLNKQYFHYGVKRAYEELNAMQTKPKNLCDIIEKVITADSSASVKEHLTILIKETIAVFHQVRENVTTPKKPVSADSLIGTYEEMYSNWRNKMYVAAATGNRHLALMSLLSFNEMLSEISREVSISRYNALTGYNAQDLQKTAKAYDDILSAYQKEYEKAGIQVKHYSNIDTFVQNYDANQ